MVNIGNPMMDAEMDDTARAYVGILERQVLGLTIAVYKQGAVIEQLSGKPYEEVLKDLEDGEILKLAVDAASDKLGVSKSEARRIVRSRAV